MLEALKELSVQILKVGEQVDLLVVVQVVTIDR